MGKTEKTKRAAESTLLVLVIDRSGSMQSIQEDMEGGIKTLLAEQAKEKGTCLVTIAQFDDEYELLADGVPMAELEPYRLVPRGSTALLDALGRTIAHVKGRLDGLSAEDVPGHVMVAVVTDGMENASQEWSHMQVMDSVKARVADGWDFTFLGANQDAIQEGGNIGFPAGSSLSYAATKDGTREAFSALSSSMGRKRRGVAKSLQYTDDERLRSTGS